MKVFLGVALGVAVLAALILAACTIIAPKGPRYTICMANRTRHRFDNVWVYYGTEIAAAPGKLLPGGYATYGFVTLPVPEEAVVTWALDGVHYAPKVKLEGIVPRCPRHINIWFIIEEDSSVTVKNVSDADRATNQSLLKTLLDYRETEKR
jgi:hypothetical protein